VMTLRTCGADERATVRWLDRMLASRGAAVHLDRLASLERVLVGGLREALVMGVFLWAAYLCLSGEESVGSIIALQMLAERYVSMVCDLGGALSPVLAALAQVKRVDALLAHEDVTRRGMGSLVGEVPQGDAIVLEDVWFRYGPDQPWVLQGYNLRIPSLAHHELRGPSGTGKSTVLRIIAGLYAPERGTVLVFGRSPIELRGQICYLPQDSQLFQGSILQNLRLLSGASDAEILRAAERSGLGKMVQCLPMGYETVLSAGAVTLSGGQRQLIMWTAAMASKRKLLLLDEALSHVDPIARGGLLSMASERAHTIVSVEHQRRPANAPPLATQREPVVDHFTAR
jgi:ABC-type bacteriocin/lantibiotic exporter with double-glycine peptidase domain